MVMASSFVAGAQDNEARPKDSGHIKFHPWQKNIIIPPHSDHVLEKGQWPSTSDNQLPVLKRALRIFKHSIRPTILTKGLPAKKQLSRTAYLDGSRGFAALLLYVHHHKLWVRESDGDSEIFENKFGYKGRHHLPTFPLMRLIFCGGHFAVPIFFVVSACALSVTPLSLIHAGECDKLGDSFASSIFRRWMRLWMPVCITTFIYMALCHYPGFYTDDFVFDTGGNLFFPFNGHLWTIPVELTGSGAVYLVLIACSRFTPKARLGCMPGLIYYFIYVADGCFHAIFIAGVLLTDLDRLALTDQLPRVLARLEPYKELIYLHLLVVGCYLGGAVHRVRGTAAGAHQALLREPALPVPGPGLLCAVGWTRIRHETGIPMWVDAWPMSRAGPLGLEWAFLVPHLILLPVTLWMAEICTRFIDTPSVQVWADAVPELSERCIAAMGDGSIAAVLGIAA
ncbi:acyltransferase [Diplocarpon rosae]|nr:acyltransferase [Diplocarpon rosae]